MATFRTDNYPSLVVARADGPSLRFTGGVLEAAEEDAQAVRDLATNFPEYGIVEGGDAAPATTPEGTGVPADEAKDPTNEELKEALRERGLPVTGNKDDLILRLAEADADEDDEDA